MIPTFNRDISELTKELKRLYPCTIIVVDDGSDQKVNTKNVDLFYRFDKNNGKKKWWVVVNKLWELGRSVKSDYYIMTVDDALPNKNFFIDSVRLFKLIRDKRKIAMHLANNGRAQNWTRFNRVSYNSCIFKTQTTETSFIAIPEFLNYTIPPIPLSRWNKNPRLGSGVFSRICSHFVSRGWNIYGVKKSLIHQNKQLCTSKMNPEARMQDPWKLL